MHNIENNLVVLVVSCDKYSDLWNPFFDCFRRFWPDCPFNVYLLSNKKTFHRDGITNITIGDDVSWSDSLKKGLEQLRQDYVLLFLDDLFLYLPVDNKKALGVIEWAIESQANYIRMNPMNNKADKPLNDSVGIISKGALYRASTVMSVWKKDVLLDLLRGGESAWDFETYGSIRSDKYDKFYAAWEDCFAIINAAIKGKWHRGAIKKLKSLGIEIDTKSREVMTHSEALGLYFKIFRSWALNLFPARYRRKIKSFILRGKCNY